MCNFSEMLLRARSAQEFSHGQDPKLHTFIILRLFFAHATVSFFGSP